MVLIENPRPTFNMPQSVLPLREADPRTSEQSLYVEVLNKYIWDSLAKLREGQVKALNSRFAPLDLQLDSLVNLNHGWDGYDAPPPTRQTLSVAREILGKLQGILVMPQRISPSADGGVAFSFKASGNRRAQIEVLNNGEKFAHLYDLTGNSYTLDWPKNIEREPFETLLEPILNYMQS
jgi:hypothetical protein